MPTAHNLFNLAANIGSFVVPPDGEIDFEVLANGSIVPGYLITFAPGETGVKTLAFGPVALPPGGTFSIRATPTVGTTWLWCLIGPEPRD